MAHQSLIAQAGRPKKKSKKNSSEAELSKEEIQEMDAQANKIKEDFVKQMATLATDYANGGEYEKSKAILRKLKEIAPEISGVKEKIQKLNQALMSKNEMMIDFKVTSGGWGSPLGFVTEDKKIRIQVDGKYKFISSALLSPEGFPTSKPPKIGMSADIPCGALMGIVVNKGKKPSKPFYIGFGRDFTPKKSGVLFVKVNVPPGSKCIGKMKIQLSGAITPAGK